MPTDLDIDRYCIGCGYNLRGIASDRCPECGLDTAATGSAVAWEGRKHMGIYRAFRQTVLNVSFRPRRLAEARAFPVSDTSAWSFRVVVAVLSALPPAIVLWIAIAVEGGTGFLSIWKAPQSGWPPPPSPYALNWEIPVLWSAGATRLLVLPIGFLLTVYLITGMPRFWVRPQYISPEYRNRAAALSAYLSAPLIFLFIPTAAAALIWQTSDPNFNFDWRIQWVAKLFAAVCLVLILLLYLVNSLRFVRAVTHCGPGRLIAMTIGLFIGWLLSIVVGMALFPMLAGLIWLMIDSLRP